MKPAATTPATRQPSSEIGRLVQVLVVNAFLLYGLWRFGWGTTTALALYWCENVLGSAFVLLRLRLHRSLTDDPQYRRNQLGVSTGSGDKSHKIASYIQEVATGTFVFSAAHALFLGVMIGKFLPEAGGTPLDPAAFGRGLVVVVVILALGFLADLRGLRQRPFAWARDLGQRALGRVLVVHLSIIFGFAMLAWKHDAQAFLATFAIIKLLFDVGSSLPRHQPEPATSG